jgi:Fur family ferric uptake transcriptional regulator
MENGKLRKLGLKITMPRLKILKILEGAKRHLSAEDVHKKLLLTDGDVGLATVYRVLTQFVEAGLIKRQNFENGFAVFELDEGPHHDHLVCVKCGRVDEFVDETIEERQKLAAKKAGYQMTAHNLIIYGICKKCVVK